jgi:60 kDa SS-A/Ro ribonucleoprotein
MARTNVRPAAPGHTHEGAPSVTPLMPPEFQLRRTVLACMLWEDTFYEGGQTVAHRIQELASKVPLQTIADIAIEARERMKLRHAPLLLLREMLRWNANAHAAQAKGRAHRDGAGRLIGDTIWRVVQRADEAAELLSIYWKDSPDAPLPAQLKRGLSRAVLKFREYELAKYDREGAIQLRDVAFLTRVAPGKNLRMGRRIARLVNKDFYPDETKGAHFKVKEMYGLGDYQKLDTPDTWETELSAGKDKGETFKRLMAEKKLGALALLRNLRNMLQSGVPEDQIRLAIAGMKTDRVLPFRFVAAARHAPQLEPDLEVAMLKCLAGVEKLPGKTVLLIDHSGSMDDKVSAKSEISRFDAAAALAIILRETAQNVRVFAFSDTCKEIAPRRGFALRDAIDQSMPSSGTNTGTAVNHVFTHCKEMDRLIIVTDEQSHQKIPPPGCKGYIINVGTYKNGIGYGDWVTINGWSEAVLDYIRVSEELETLAAREGEQAA